MIIESLNILIIALLSFFIGGFSTRFLPSYRKQKQELAALTLNLATCESKQELYFDQINDLTSQNNKRIQENLDKNNEINCQKREIFELKDNFTRSETSNKFIKENLEDLKQNHEQLKSEKAKVDDLYLDVSRKLASLDSQKQSLDDNFKLMNESLLHQFKNIAANVMNENSEKFTEESRRKIDILINPLHEKIKDFQSKMQECFNIDIKEKFSLKESIDRIIFSNDQIRTEASKLSSALKGNRITLGHWGEIVLENILTSSGLRKDQDYFLQSNLQSNADDPSKLKPDVLIKLPDDKYIVIDAKTSFFDHNAYDDSIDDSKKELVIKQFVQRIKNHVENLSSKEYHSSLGLNTPEITLMFIPIESWYNLAMQHCPEIYNYAWSRNIAIISPSTLFVILKTISYIWKGKIQTQNSLKIADQAGKLYDQFVEFLANLTDVGKAVEKASNSYDKALSRLQNGRGNLISRAEKMRLLGINHAKKIDSALILHESDVPVENLVKIYEEV